MSKTGRISSEIYCL